jgi:hypothetical protein
MEHLKIGTQNTPPMQRTAISSVEVTFAICIALALGVWTLLGLFDSGQAGRGLVLVAVGLFAIATAVWSRIRRKRDEEL